MIFTRCTELRLDRDTNSLISSTTIRFPMVRNGDCPGQFSNKSLSLLGITGYANGKVQLVFIVGFMRRYQKSCRNRQVLVSSSRLNKPLIRIRQMKQKQSLFTPRFNAPTITFRLDTTYTPNDPGHIRQMKQDSYAKRRREHTPNDTALLRQMKQQDRHQPAVITAIFRHVLLVLNNYVLNFKLDLREKWSN